MNAQKFTQKSLEAIQAAQDLTIANQNMQMEEIHLLVALLEQDGGLIPQLLLKMGLPVEEIAARARRVADSLSRVSGPGREAGKIYISGPMDAMLTEAEKTAAHMKDEYVSVEHLFLAMLDHPDGTTREIFKDFRIEKNAFLKALAAVRGNTRVTDDTPESTYDALKKYGDDLVERARSTIPLLAGTTKSATSSGSSPGKPKTTPSSSASRASARPPSPRGWPSGSSAATCPTASRTRPSSPWTWAPLWPARNTAASSRRG